MSVQIATREAATLLVALAIAAPGCVPVTPETDGGVQPGHDGGQIQEVYQVALPAGDHLAIYEVGGRNGLLHEIPAPNQVWAPTWSPTGDKLAYWSPENDGYYYSSSVFLYDLGAQGVVDEMTDAALPDWSPLGDKIVATGYPDYGIKLFDVATGTTAPLDPDYFKGLFARWDPTGAPRFAFVSMTSYELEVATSNGSPQSKFLVAPDVRAYSWSPTGDAIAYASMSEYYDAYHYYYTQTCNLAKASLTAGSVVNTVAILNVEQCFSDVQWSPSDDFIAFTDGNLIWLTQTDSAFPVRIRDLSVVPISSPHQVHAMAWSPDGKYLAFGAADDYYSYYDTLYLFDPARGNLATSLANLPAVSGLSFRPLP